jgi:hypothetical protein
MRKTVGGCEVMGQENGIVEHWNSGMVEKERLE